MREVIIVGFDVSVDVTCRVEVELKFLSSINSKVEVLILDVILIIALIVLIVIIVIEIFILIRLFK